jgi:transposase
MNKHDVCGIEVSAKRLLVGLERESTPRTRREFPNTPQGHQALVHWLLAPGRTVRVVMEATGLYGLDLALRLDAEASLELMIANPRAVRHFAHALMKRSKNDPIDTGVLVEFARRMPFRPWVRPSAAALTLHALAHRLESLTEMHAAEKNRLHAAQLSPALPAAVVRDLQRSLRSLERALDRITRQAVEVIGQDPHLNLRYQLLLTACGIAPTSAVQILAQLGLCSHPIWTFDSGSPRPASTPASIPPAVRCTRKPASARPATGTCVAPSTCPPWWPFVMNPISALSTSASSSAAKPKCRPWSPSCANSSTPSSACLNTSSPSTVLKSTHSPQPLCPSHLLRRPHDPIKEKNFLHLQKRNFS